MKPGEDLVARVFPSIVPGCRLELRRDQSRGEWDFDLHRAPGVVEPLEVTVATDQELEHTFSAISGRSGDRQTFARRLAKSDWFITPLRDARIKDIRAKADAYLAAIESEGRSRFDSEIDEWESPAVRRIFRELRVERGAAVTLEPPGLIWLGYPGSASWLGPDLVLEAVSVEAQKSDNRAKLGRSTAGERHLAVVLDSPDAFARYAMIRGPLPERPADLPSEITTVWVFGRHPNGQKCRVWRNRKDQPWEDLGEFDAG